MNEDLALPLQARWGALDLTAYPYTLLITPAPDFGTPEIEYTEGDGDLVDGSTVQSSRAGNREVTFHVMVEGQTTPRFEEACVALERQADLARSELAVDEGRMGGAPWALDTYRAALSMDFEATREAQLLRVYEVTLPADPWVRSVDEVVSPAVTDGSDPVTPVTTTLYSGSGITGWVGGGGTATASSGGGVAVGRGSNGIVSLTSPAYSWGTDTWMSAQVAGQITPPVPRADWGEGFRTPDARYGGRYFWRLTSTPAGGKVKFEGFVVGAGGMTVRNVQRHNTVPGPSPKMLVRSIDIKGSARTPASLEVVHPTAALGQALVYTWPDDTTDYQPACQQYFVPALQTETASTDAWSGVFLTLTASVPGTFEIPVSALPQGLYRAFVRARCSGTTTRTVGLSAWTRHGATDYAPRTLSASASFTGTAPLLVDLGAITLPTGATPSGSSAVARLQVTVSGDTDLDELLLFNVSTGVLSSLATGAAKGLWLDSPTIDRSQPTVWVSSTTDKAAARHLEHSAITSWGNHLFPAGRVSVFTACGANNALASAKYFPRGRHSTDVRP